MMPGTAISRLTWMCATSPTSATFLIMKTILLRMLWMLRRGMAGGGVSADDLKHACLCKACDGLGCPTCQPERFGLHPKSKIGDGNSFAILKDKSLIPDLPAFLDQEAAGMNDSSVGAARNDHTTALTMHV